MKNVVKFSGIFSILILIIVCIIWFDSSKPQEALAGAASGTFNVIGTRVGTTTTEGGFYKTAANNGTSSVPINIGTKTDSANFTIRLINASTTPSSIFTYNILGSNDFNCETATTSTTASSQVIKKDINWYSLSTMGQFTNTSLGTATGTVVSLTNLTWQCLNFEANGSSTAVLVQLITKDSAGNR